MDIRPYKESGDLPYVNYSVLGGAPPGDVDRVFPYDVVPGLINGTGLWNGSDLFSPYDVINGSNVTNVTCPGNATTCGDAEGGLPMWQVVFFGILAVATIIITIVGNLIVILSFFIERSIRQPTNYFIASLAMSDLFIGTMSMPFYTVYLLSGQRWPLGKYMCDFWLSVDYTVCLTSIYTVFAITIDRFCSVKIPAKYRNWRTERKVVIIIATTWVIPILVFFTSIFGWPYFVGERTVPEEMCYVQYLEEAIFSCILQVCYFWSTLIVMFILYTGIYKVALDLQRKSEAKRNKMTSLVSMAGQTMTRIGIGMSQQAAVDARKLFNQSETNNATTPTTPDTATEPLKPKQSADNKVNNNHGASSTSFTSLKNPDPPEDRSSSPAFPSDTDPSSQSPKRSPQPQSKSKRSRSQAGTDGSFKLQKPPKGKRAHKDKHSNNLAAVNSNTHLSPPPPPDVDATPTPDDDGKVAFSRTPPPSYEQLATVDTTVVMENHTGPPATDDDETATDAEVVKFIDQESLKSPQSNDNLRMLTEAAARIISKSQEEGSNEILEEPESPVWKMRDGKTSANSSPEKMTLIKPCHPSPRHDIEPATPGVVSLVESPEPSPMFTPSPNHHGPATLQVETRGRDNKPVTQLARLTDGKKRCKGKDGGGGSPLSSIVKTMRKSRRARAAKSKEKQKKQSRTENRARKALRTITIILGAFVLCWTPWHILSLIIGFTPEESRTGTSWFVLLKLYDISYWLCYLNSPINPFCYAMANAQFKKAFIRIMKLDWHRS